MKSQLQATSLQQVSLDHHQNHHSPAKLEHHQSSSRGGSRNLRKGAVPPFPSSLNLSFPLFLLCPPP